jgi:hypothetical protein
MQVQRPRGREFRLWRLLSALKGSRIRSTLPMWETAPAWASFLASQDAVALLPPAVARRRVRAARAARLVLLPLVLVSELSLRRLT